MLKCERLISTEPLTDLPTAELMLEPSVTLDELLSDAVPERLAVAPKADAPTLAVTDRTDSRARVSAALTVLELLEEEVA